MSPLQRLREIKQRAQTLVFHDFPPETTEAAKRYAAEAYRSCVAWYGPPVDSQKPYKLVQKPGNSSYYFDPILGTHYVMISQDATTPEQLCHEIAHEMYHRVTAGRKGLAGEMWIQEMLACLASYWFLQEQGFSEYAEAVKKVCLNTPGAADVSLLRASHRRIGGDWILRGGGIYSTEFINSIQRLSYAFNYLDNRNSLCHIVKVNTIEEWVASLPKEKQYTACCILELPCEDKVMPDNAKEWDRLFVSLKTKGDTDTLVSEFEQIAHRQPSDGVAAYNLGRAYQQAEQFDAACDAYLKALELKFSNKWLPYSLANCYWQREDYSSAAQWFQEAINRELQWPSAFFWLGRSFIKTGELLSARQAWEKVLTLEDEDYKKLAQKYLQNNPLPDARNEDSHTANSTT